MKTKADYQRLHEALQEEMTLIHLFKNAKYAKVLEINLKMQSIKEIKSQFNDYEIELVSEMMKIKPKPSVITDNAKKHKKRLKKESEENQENYDHGLEDELFLFLLTLILVSNNDFDTIVIISLLKSFIKEDKKSRATYKKSLDKGE